MKVLREVGLKEKERKKKNGRFKMMRNLSGNTYLFCLHNRYCLEIMRFRRAKRKKKKKEKKK